MPVKKSVAIFRGLVNVVWKVNKGRSCFLLTLKTTFSVKYLRLLFFVECCVKFLAFSTFSAFCKKKHHVEGTAPNAGWNKQKFIFWKGLSISKLVWRNLWKVLVVENVDRIGPDETKWDISYLSIWIDSKLVCMDSS